MPKVEASLESLKMQRALIDAQIVQAQKEENERRSRSTLIGTANKCESFSLEWYPETKTLDVYGSNGCVHMSVVQLLAVSTWISAKLDEAKTERLASKA